jgi:hypothetical protein
MPYVNKPRPYKKEYQQQKERGEHPDRMERQRARRKIDATKGKSARAGKDVAHVKALSKGGSNKDGVRLESPSKNRSFPRKSDGSMK